MRGDRLYLVGRDSSGVDRVYVYRLERLLRRVALPPGFTLMHASDGFVWGLETDDLDVPYLVRYRVAG